MKKYFDSKSWTAKVKAHFVLYSKKVLTGDVRTQKPASKGLPPATHGIIWTSSPLKNKTNKQKDSWKDRINNNVRGYSDIPQIKKKNQNQNLLIIPTITPITYGKNC